MSNNNNSATASVSVPVFSLLAAVLVVLKLLGAISISWLWVFAPVWIPLLAFFTIFVIIMVVALIGGVFSK